MGIWDPDTGPWAGGAKGKGQWVAWPLNLSSKVGCFGNGRAIDNYARTHCKPGASWVTGTWGWSPQLSSLAVDAPLGVWERATRRGDAERQSASGTWAHGSNSPYPGRTDVSNVLAHNGSRDRNVTFSGILRAGCYTIDSLKWVQWAYSSPPYPQFNFP